MARAPLSYKTENNLANLFTRLQARRIAEKGGIKVNMADIDKEVADYCGVSNHTIHLIKQQVNQPSLPVAMRLAKFFGLTVEDIFKLVDIKCDACGTVWNGEKWEKKGNLGYKYYCQSCGEGIDK
ncbi:helix-turn-helix transcriptional regulator [Brevibacillus laterosporus]|uniref:helix-turn-helix transcriptional regulator n=1 Tax=Brevibacillus laterosporus TaxID=1465 RepID=UPI003D245B33